MPWRWILRTRAPDPQASRRADAVTRRLDHLAADLQTSVDRLEALANRLEGLDDDGTPDER